MSGVGESSPTDYADGSVHPLTMGSSELSLILSSAAERRQLVVVDFSAAWCGPCKMMMPVLGRLAGEHRGRVAFCKVDCEETPRNKELAREAGVSAFPTFHLYRDNQRVAECRGANPPQLQQLIQQQLTLLGGSPQHAQQQGGGGRPGPMAAALAQALARVRGGCSYEEFLAAARTLLTFVSNALAHPEDPKYRRVRVSNPGFNTKLGSKPGGLECMAALGFKEEAGEGGEGVLVLGSIPSELPHIKTLLEQALPGGGATASAMGSAAAAGAGGSQAGGAGGVVAGTGAGTTPAGPPLDPAELARVLAAVMAGGGGGAGQRPQQPSPVAATPAPTPAAAATPGGGMSAGGSARAAPRQQQQQRVVRVTPAMLAKVLERMLAEGGWGAGASGGAP